MIAGLATPTVTSTIKPISATTPAATQTTVNIPQEIQVNQQTSIPQYLQHQQSNIDSNKQQ